MFLIFSICCGFDGAEVIKPPPKVFQHVEMVETIKKDLEEANQKLDCIPEILDKNVSKECKKLITLKK